VELGAAQLTAQQQSPADVRNIHHIANPSVAITTVAVLIPGLAAAEEVLSLVH
jgi:hypothetical protein